MKHRSPKRGNFSRKSKRGVARPNTPQGRIDARNMGFESRNGAFHLAGSQSKGGL